MSIYAKLAISKKKITNASSTIRFNNNQHCNVPSKRTSMLTHFTNNRPHAFTFVKCLLNHKLKPTHYFKLEK